MSEKFDRRDAKRTGRLDKVALSAVSLATEQSLGAGLLALVDVAHDAVVLSLRNLRTLEGAVTDISAHTVTVTTATYSAWNGLPTLICLTCAWKASKNSAHIDEHLTKQKMAF